MPAALAVTFLLGAGQAQHAGAAPLAPWAKSARKAAKFTPWRPAPGKLRGADPTGLGLEGSPARSSVKRVAGRSHAGSRASQGPAEIHTAVHNWEAHPVTLTARVATVDVDVVVRDRDGKPIGGLTKDNFRISTDGTQRPITLFSAIASGTGLPPAVAADAGEPRYVGLFFDDVQTNGTDLARAREAARNFVHQSLLPGDHVCIFTASSSQNVPCTVDRAGLEGAIARIRRHPQTAV